MNMIIGFTGTRYGMSANQLQSFRLIMEELIDKTIEFHHGCCIGADIEAACIVAELTRYRTESIIIEHPPIKNAWLQVERPRARFTHSAKDYYARNIFIVKSCNLLIAAPRSLDNQSGGTWYTIKYAQEKNKPTIILGL